MKHPVHELSILKKQKKRKVQKDKKIQKKRKDGNKNLNALVFSRGFVSPGFFFM
jgi:hypothetical protein